MNHLVIMAGGIGSRFWPISTPEFPKQFIDILGVGKTMIQQTLERFGDFCPPENVWVVTNAAYVPILAAQLPSLKPEHILAEPAARNTAPCIAWAAECICREDADAVVAVSPSDAYVRDSEEFRRVLGNAAGFCKGREAIVTVGIMPSRPETGYGYIKTSDSVDESGVVRVESFREKPDQATAESYLAEGGYLWNAGIFVFDIKAFKSLLSIYKPSLSASIVSMVENGDVARIFPELEKISIDYALMEPAAAAGKVYTHPAEFGWSDLGNWSSLYERLPLDEDGNAVVGNVELIECRNCIVHAEDAEKVVVQGLVGYVVSVRKGRVLMKPMGV